MIAIKLFILIIHLFVYLKINYSLFYLQKILLIFKFELFMKLIRK
jgi:hypothetical protein